MSKALQIRLNEVSNALESNRIAGLINQSKRTVNVCRNCSGRTYLFKILFTYLNFLKIIGYDKILL